jgi:hypothetical protein
MDNNLIEEFAEFLRGKGKDEEADSMLNAYGIFEKGLEDLKKEMLEEAQKQVEEPEEELTAADGIAIADCTFLTIAILPNGDMHMVDISSDNIADAIADTGKFRVAEEPMGRAEIKTHFLGGNSTDKKYLN